MHGRLQYSVPTKTIFVIPKQFIIIALRRPSLVSRGSVMRISG